MRRFTDFFVFAAMLIIDFVMVYLLYSPELSTMNPNSFDMSFALLNLGFIALPALVLAMFIALVRAIWNIPPRQFYLVLLIAAAASSGLIWVISLAFGKQATPAQLSLPVFQFGALAVAMFIGLILGLTGAVPTVQKVASRVEKDADQKALKADENTRVEDTDITADNRPRTGRVEPSSSPVSQETSNSESAPERGTLAVTHSSGDTTSRSMEDMKPNGHESPYVGHEHKHDPENEAPYIGHEHHRTPDDEPMLGGIDAIPTNPRRVKGESDTDE